MRQKIGIVDYNTSNIANVIRAIKYCNADFKLITKHTDLKNITKLILPGVGSFVEASNFLSISNISGESKLYKKPVKSCLIISL